MASSTGNMVQGRWLFLRLADGSSEGRELSGVVQHDLLGLVVPLLAVVVVAAPAPVTAVVTVTRRVPAPTALVVTVTAVLVEVLPESSPLGGIFEPELEVTADVLLVALHVLNFDFFFFLILAALDLHLLQFLHVLPLCVLNPLIRLPPLELVLLPVAVHLLVLLQSVHRLLLLLFDLLLFGFWLFLCFGVFLLNVVSIS